MQEASSISKAIEKAWEAAGHPKEFSIKIFEDPKKNFIGMTVQSAKVGIFFNDKVTTVDERKQKSESYQKRADTTSSRSSASPRTSTPQDAALVKRNNDTKPQLKERAPQIKPVPASEATEVRVLWSPEMITAVQDWLTGACSLLGIDNLPCKIETSRYYLTVHLQMQVASDQEKEKQLCRSFSVLLMQALRHTFKRPLRGFKIIVLQAP